MNALPRSCPNCHEMSIEYEPDDEYASDFDPAEETSLDEPSEDEE